MKESQPVLMTDQALQTLVEKISIVFFQKPFLHQATFNRRLKTTGGRYHLASHHLDFNPTVFLKYGQEELEKVIKHELCHYHLHLAGKGYQHKDKDFKELLAKTGGRPLCTASSRTEKSSFPSVPMSVLWRSHPQKTTN